MTTRPTDTPEWSTTGIVVEPAPAKQAAGFIFQEFVPFGWMNWGWNRFAAWAAHFAGAASKFVGQEGAYNTPAAAPFVPGDSCIVVEPGDYTGIPGEKAIGVDNAVFATMVIAMGDEVLFAEPGHLEAYARDGSGSLGVYPNFIIAGTVRVRADDVHVIAYTNAVPPADNVEIYDRATRTLLASISVGVGGGTPRDVVLGRDLFFVATNNGGGAGFADLHAYNYAGVLQWSYTHANAAGIGIAGVAHFGRYVYIYGDASAFASTATVRAIEAANGFDVAGEGGLGTSTLPGVWDSAALPIATTGGPNPSKIIKCDGRILAIAEIATADTVYIRAPFSGAAVASWVVADLNGIDLDRENVYTNARGDTVSVRSRVAAFSRADSFAHVWTYESGIGAPFTNTMTMSSDGSAVFIEDRSAGIGNRGVKLHKRNDPRLWAKVDPTVDEGLPFRREII